MRTHRAAPTETLTSAGAPISPKLSRSCLKTSNKRLTTLIVYRMLIMKMSFPRQSFPLRSLRGMPRASNLRWSLRRSSARRRNRAKTTLTELGHTNNASPQCKSSQRVPKFYSSRIEWALFAVMMCMPGSPSRKDSATWLVLMIIETLWNAVMLSSLCLCLIWRSKPTESTLCQA